MGDSGSWLPTWRTLGLCPPVRPLASIVLVTTLSASVVLGLFLVLAGGTHTSRWRVTIDAVSQPNSALVYVAMRRGYFSEAGVAVTIRTHATGKAALAHQMDTNDGYAVCADTPLVRAIIEHRPVATIAAVSDQSGFIRIIGRRSAGVANLASLAHKRTGYAPGTNSEFALRAALLLEGIDSTSATLVPLSGEELVAQLGDGRLDAAALWEPHQTVARSVLADDCVEVDTQNVYRAMWLMVRSSTRVDVDQDVAVLSALRQASKALPTLSPEELRTLALDMGLSASWLPSQLDNCTFRINLSHTLILNLEAQLRADGVPMEDIDLLSVIDPRALAISDRHAVSLVHPAIR